MVDRQLLCVVPETPCVWNQPSYTYIKSIKEILPLDKCVFEHKFGRVSVQSIQKAEEKTYFYLKNIFKLAQMRRKTFFKTHKCFLHLIITKKKQKRQEMCKISKTAKYPRYLLEVHKKIF